MRPISGAVICHSGTRIGSTKAIDSALNASKNVALPMMTRARTYQRDVGTCSIRMIREVAASSGANEETAGASDRGSALATDKGFLPFCSIFRSDPIGQYASHASWPDTHLTLGAPDIRLVSNSRFISIRISFAITAGHSIG